MCHKVEGYTGSSSATTGGVLPDFEGQIPPAAIFPVYTVLVIYCFLPSKSCVVGLPDLVVFNLLVLTYFLAFIIFIVPIDTS